MSFEIISIVIFALWAIALGLFFYPNTPSLFKRLSEVLIFGGILLLLAYIISIWIALERAPMRTLGETRLWYAFFLSTIGMVIYYRWKLNWMILFSLIFASLFLSINLMHPEVFDKALMPALQSYWFVPHVIVYILAYALLGASTLIALKGLWLYYRKKHDETILEQADNIIYIGFSFLTFGLLFGALWAKEAWGHYWTWDPKETWAFITWMLYLIYIHFRYHRRKTQLAPLWILTLAFAVLMICWFGLNYLPSAQNSVHTYSSTR